MPLNVITERAALKRLWSLIDSNDWWIIPWISETACELSHTIEESHFAGDKNAAFVVMTCTRASGVFAVSLAHKRHLSVHALARLMRDSGAARVTAADLRHQDIIFCFAEDEGHVVLQRGTQWAVWLQAGRRPDPARRHTPLATERRR